MGLSNAERQRKYREKQKRLNKTAFLEKEAKRKRDNYVPSGTLPPKELKKRREDQKLRSRKRYDKIRKPKAKQSDDTEPGPSTDRLVVRLPSLKKRGHNVRKTYSRSLRKSYRDNELLREKNITLTKKNKTLQKRLERMRPEHNASLDTSSADADESNMEESETSFAEMTPRRKTNAQMQSLGLDRKKQNNVKRTLLLSNTIVHNFKPSLKEKKKKSSFPVWTNALRDYRCVSELERTTGIGRKKLANLQKKRKVNMMMDQIKEAVVEFLEREDNSTTLPGKSDTVTIRVQQGGASLSDKSDYLNTAEDNESDMEITEEESLDEIDSEVFEEETLSGESDTGSDPDTDVEMETTEERDDSKEDKGKVTKQKHVLTDYMQNLYAKFQLENPDIKISKATFYRLRPAHVILADFANRRTCLCSRHQNLALKIKALISLGIKCSKNPDIMIKNYDTNESMIHEIESLDVQTIQYREWRKVPDGDKLRMKEIDIMETKEKFIETFGKVMTEFREHVDRIRNQYSQMRALREKLPENEVVVWMDFAENYGCTSVDEIQSAYWNSSMVSLHTMVVYHSDKSVQSYVAISDVLSHNSIAVYTILRKLIPQLKESNPNLSVIHYLTDSPTSQYRNKTIFQYVAMHKEEFGLDARWSYLESGHGKGPCDGLGASVKRGADNAIKQGKLSIQDTNDFFNWAVSSMESGSKVKFFKYTQDEYNDAEKMLSERPRPAPLKGTFKVHYVVGTGNKDEIYARILTCYCENCTNDISTTECAGYFVHKVIETKKGPTEKTKHSNKSKQGISEEINSRNDSEDLQSEEDRLEETSNPSDITIDQLTEGTWVTAVYIHNNTENWYIGKIVEVDETDGEIHVDFLESSGKYGDAYKWPQKKDQLWVKKNDVLYVLKNEPQKTGKTGRLFKIDHADMKEIDKIINAKNN